MTRRLVVPYDPTWPDQFRRLRARLAPCIAAGAVAIEHVGSTSVPGLAAKPIIDLDVVTPPGGFEAVCRVLEDLGYVHEGDKGVPGREAFRIRDPEVRAETPAHHLYVCEEGAAPLRRHRLFRDFFRARPELVPALSAAKREAAERAGHERKLYMELKAPTYARVIARARREADRPD